MDFNEIARAFDKPVGYYIQGDDELRQWKPSVLSFGYSFANVEPRLILDSEQPRLELCNGEFDSSNKTAGFSEITRFDIVDAVVRPHEVFELNHHHCEPGGIELVFIGVSSNTSYYSGWSSSSSPGPRSQSLPTLQETSCQRRTASASQHRTVVGQLHKEPHSCQIELRRPRPNTEGDSEAKGCDSPAASPALLAFDYQPIPKGYRLPARSPPPPVFSSPPVALVLPLPLLRLAPWPPKLRPLLTPSSNLAVLPGALGAGSNVLLTSNLPGMEEEVDTFADTVIIVDDDTPASDLHQLRTTPTTAPAATQSSSKTAIAKRTKEQQLWDRDTVLSDKTYPGSGRYREPCH
ncbi:uncharacterized protein N7525_009873 [Penicillium rubens]|uniref:uncharacterized protein n=1 Tax=Penicillium rubens TaxID=1108849 RepID=UPI002A5A2E56|nr:uncharacterized protein N7525_009873 [Penicillium rubens]KAJ5831620.1 hypothetical protein N7525_009873 [Penicillium rubens]